MAGGVADIRVFRSALSSVNLTTLASINPATDVSGNYADPDDALGALGWWKLNGTTSGTLDMTDSAGTTDGTAYGATKSGFVTMSRADAGTWNLTPNYVALVSGAYVIYPLHDLTNTYVTDSTDCQVASGATFLTKGTVVLD